jgi:ATP-dependent DNA helicase RecQ
LKDIIKKYWGFDGFLPLQKEAMECVLSGRDSIVVLPTGGGKSLCFQGPAMAMEGTAVVVSPLISLMKDQVDSLSECGVSGVRIDSTLTGKEKSEIFSRIRGGEVKIIYLSPERIVMEGFVEFLRETPLSFIAIDEAHCISHWGHDFRPEYRQLGRLKKWFPNIAIHCYTATATAPVREDIALQLGLADPKILVGSFDRPNLVYRSCRRTARLKQVREVLEKHPGESGIIYCIRRRDVDDLCVSLRELGYKVSPYHAGMTAGNRKESQDDFIAEKMDIIVATVAFGMGIDKSNVRYVIHTGMPKSLEHYQQESGRAGRDGLEAECILFYSGSDYAIWKSLMKDLDPATARINLDKLSRIFDYCTGITCRHKELLSYFGQRLEAENCGACDVCLDELTLMDGSLVIAQKILSCVVRLRERFGGDYTAKVLTGSRDKRVLENSDEQLSTYGILSEFPLQAVRGWIEQLISQGYIRKGEEYGVLTVMESGWLVMRGDESPRLLEPPKKKVRAKVSRAVRDSWEGVDQGLFEALRELRREIAARKHLPAYIVFGDAALRDMARKRPSANTGFLLVTGVGEKKCRQYGDDFLELIKDYSVSHGLDLDRE